MANILKACICINIFTFEYRFKTIIERMALSEYERGIIQNHFIFEMNKITVDVFRQRISYEILTWIITIGTILMSVFLSLQKMYTGLPAEALFWTNLSLSVFVIISNKILYLFGIHQYYLLNQELRDRYELEAWSFTSGVNAYSKCKNVQESFMLFMTRFEKLQVQKVSAVLKIAKESRKSEDIVVAGGSTYVDKSGAPIKSKEMSSIEELPHTESIFISASKRASMRKPRQFNIGEISYEEDVPQAHTPMPNNVSINVTTNNMRSSVVNIKEQIMDIAKKSINSPKKIIV